MFLEIETLPGLKKICLAELRQRIKHPVEIIPCNRDDVIRVVYEFSPSDFHVLKTAAVVYFLLHFDVPRPKALLGHEHFRRLTGQIDRIRGMHPSGSFRTFRIGAAGKNSSVFERIKTEIGIYTRMENVFDESDLLLRVRPSQLRRGGWDVLLRSTPRPLLTRSWRVCNMRGALNASVAAAMVRLTRPHANDRFFNPMCGSGTLLIERGLYGPSQTALGCDISNDALACAKENIQAADLENQIEIQNMDATRLRLPDKSVDVICVDVPWGHHVGTHNANMELYPAMMQEMTRVADSNARMVVVTHEINLFQTVLDDFVNDWKLQKALPVLQGGLHPRIYVLSKI